MSEWHTVWDEGSFNIWEGEWRGEICVGVGVGGGVVGT